MKFSVLLLYPDYLSDQQETYYAQVEANDAGKAIANAKITAAKAQKLDDADLMQTAADFRLLLALEGWHNDLSINH